MLFNMPNAFSKSLGENTKEMERLISKVLVFLGLLKI